ncbi:MAG TPA: TetR/AcrR family transcriptional regulator [Hydrogenophaga sp.]
MEMKEQILRSAQRLVQQRGFNGFSYADVASEVGIRKASLHHHFPSKTDLGLALIEAYSAQFDNERARISASPMKADMQLRAYVAIYRTSLDADRVCLGGMLASESLTLDPAMLPGLKRFFARNTEWLTEILATGVSQQVFALNGSASDHARMLVAALQGALMIAHATGDHDAFDRTSALLLAALTGSG